MGIFDFFRTKKISSKAKVPTKPKTLKWYKPEEVSLIVRPMPVKFEKTSLGKIYKKFPKGNAFYDANEKKFYINKNKWACVGEPCKNHNYKRIPYEYLSENYHTTSNLSNRKSDFIKKGQLFYRKVNFNMTLDVGSSKGYKYESEFNGNILSLDDINEIKKLDLIKANKFVDLKGTLTKIKGGNKNLCIQHNSFLGLKSFKKTERWVLIKPEDVIPYLNDNAFLSAHSVKSDLEIKNEIKTRKLDFKRKFDKDKNGLPDVVESDDFSKLLRKNQKIIIEVDKSHIKDLVKLGNFLENERKKIIELFKIISKCRSISEVNNLEKLITDNINFFQLCLVHSFNMIASLKNEDLITYHEIYETFDKQKVFNSEWQNNFLEGMSELGSGIALLRRDMKTMNEAILDEMYNIGSEIQGLSYNMESFSDTVSSELNSINSGIQFNNLLGIVNTIQFGKMNKRLR